MLLAAKLAVSCLVLWFNTSFRNKLLPKKKKDVLEICGIQRMGFNCIAHGFPLKNNFLK